MNKKGYIKAKVWHDSDQDGVRDKGEKLIAKYRADARTVFDELDYHSFESGRVTINDASNKFKLFHDGDCFGKSRIVDISYFFYL